MRRLLAERRLISVVGAGGCGKTRYMLEVAGQVSDMFPDGVWWVDLASLPAGASVAAAALQSLGIRPRPRNTAIDALIHHLRDHCALLVFDNCEHLLGECVTVLQRLLADCVGVRAVATSREPLQAAGETVWRLTPLSTPSTPMSPAALRRLDAVRLFADRARFASASFRLDDNSVDLVATICARLDGIPLAIELAAGQVGALTPAQILKALEWGLGVLAGGERSTLPKHRTLRASMDWSYALLEPDEQTVFRRLAVFPADFSLDAARDVCADDQIDTDSVLVALTRLVHKSLISVVERGAIRRYKFLDTVRRYAAERLDEAGEEVAVRDRLVTFALRLLGRTDLVLYELKTNDWIDSTSAELPMLRAALEWSVSDRRGDTALHLLSGLTQFYATRGNAAYGQRWMEDVIRAANTQPSPMLVTALWSLAIVAYIAGESPRARRHAGAALAIAKELDDINAQARTLNILGSIDVVTDPVGAREFLQQGAVLADRVGDGWGRVHALAVIAASYALQGLLEQTRDAVAAAEQAAQRVGATGTIASWIWLARATAALRAADLDEAITAAQKAQALAAAVDDQVQLAWVAHCLASARRWRSSGDRTLLSPAQPSTDECEPPLSYESPHVTVLLNVAQAQDVLAAGAPARAEALLLQAAELACEVGIHTIEGECLLELADLALSRGALSEARGYIDRARSLAQLIQSPWLSSGSTARLARLAQARGHLDEAMWLACQAAIAQRDHRYRLDAIATLAHIADLHAQNGSLHEAARLHGAIDAARARLRIRESLAWLEKPATRTATPASRRNDLYDAWREGCALTLEEALSYATKRTVRHAQPTTGWGSLTSSELIIVRLVCEGYTNSAIADQLFLTTATVKAHLAHIFRKLNATNRVELAAEAGRRFSMAPAPR